jgi:hypothetical protein
MFKSGTSQIQNITYCHPLTGTLGGVILNGMMFIPSTVKIHHLVKTVTWYHLCNKHHVKIQAFWYVMPIHCDGQDAGGL